MGGGGGRGALPHKITPLLGKILKIASPLFASPLVSLGLTAGGSQWYVCIILVFID